MKNQNLMSKEDTQFPTVSTEGLMLSYMIGTMEGCELATDGTPAEFLQIDYNKGDINIKIEGEMVTILEEIDPTYDKDLIYLDIRGRKCMCVEDKKAICGTL